ALTGLANRLLLREKMDEALTRLRLNGEKFSVLVLDLNRFKAVNDTLGHPIGDALLVQVAQRLRDTAGRTDTVARPAGGRVANPTAIDGDPVEGLAGLAGRLLATIAAPYEIDDHHAVVATSVGIAIAPDNGTEVHELLRNADLALYRAKTDAKGYCFFQAEM